MKLFSPLKQALNGIKKIFLEVFVFNRKIRWILKGNIAKHYLKTYVKRVAKRGKNANLQIEPIKEYTIWQFWDKGIENAPEVVKRCVETIDKYEPDKKHVILSFDTIKDYIDIPQKYYDLLKAGKMKMAHFSDILRTMLLIKYGGCWIDSTVYLTGKLPEYITNSDLFLFKNYEDVDLDGLNMANYFIHSKPNNKMLKDELDVIEEYWKDNNYVMNYFFYLHIFTLLTKSDEENKRIWAKVPFVSFIPVQHFQRELMTQFDEQKWNAFKEQSNIHKLSYKSKALGLKKEQELSGTFYEKLIKGELN